MREFVQRLEDRRLLSATAVAGNYAGEFRTHHAVEMIHLDVQGPHTALSVTLSIDAVGTFDFSGSQDGRRLRLRFASGQLTGHVGAGETIRGALIKGRDRAMLLLRPQKSKAARQSATIPRYDHVVIVMEENHGYDQILGPSVYPPTRFPFVMWPYVLGQPLEVESDLYIRSLARNSAVLTNSHGIAHPSQPNYLALFSGSTQGVTTDATPRHSFTAPNLGGELIAAGDTFSGYPQDLPHAGYAGEDVGDYARRHAPWVNFTDVPPQDNQPFSKFPRFNQLPTVSFVIPNLQNDMHSAPASDADRWLRDHLGDYASWAVSHNSLLIVTWDEDYGTTRNHIPTLFFGAHIRTGVYDEPITHYNVLRTLEDMYGLPPTANAASATPITDVFV